MKEKEIIWRKKWKREGEEQVENVLRNERNGKFDRTFVVVTPTKFDELKNKIPNSYIQLEEWKRSKYFV